MEYYNVKQDRGQVTVPQEYSKIQSQMLQKMRRQDTDLSPVPHEMPRRYSIKINN